MKKILSAIWETAQVAIIALIVVGTIRTLIAQPFIVDGQSMTPNFNDGDYLVIDELTYRFRQPERGEVIVFKFPQQGGNYFIKRIVALPSETIKIEDGVVTIFNEGHQEGLVLDEPYILTSTSGNILATLDEGEYFVLGDNRFMSYDSRSWGVLNEDDIIGLTRFRLWPINAVKAFEAPAYY